MDQPHNLQHDGNTGISSVRKVSRKRLRHLLPELQEQVPSMFDRVDAEQLAEQFGVPRFDILEAALRDLRRAFRKGPNSESGLRLVNRRMA